MQLHKNLTLNNDLVYCSFLIVHKKRQYTSTSCPPACTGSYSDTHTHTRGRAAATQSTFQNHSPGSNNLTYFRKKGPVNMYQLFAGCVLG